MMNEDALWTLFTRSNMFTCKQKTLGKNTLQTPPPHAQ